MADLDGDAHGAQALDVGVVGLIAAAHLVAEAVHDLSDAAHADAADADEVDHAHGKGELHHHAASFLSPLPRMSEVTRSARRAAASRRPRARATSAARPSRSGSAASDASLSASMAGVVAASGISQ